jgi:YbgC/YbaW family acyl-CoA thioester hydrolase
MDAPPSHPRLVNFAETDAAGFVHFTRVLAWVEEAERAWFEALGVPQYSEGADGSRRGFPKVSVHCDYRRPLRFGDRVEVQLRPRNLGDTSMTYTFEIRREGEMAAEGAVTIVHVSFPFAAAPGRLPLPEAFRSPASPGAAQAQQ